MNKPTLQIDLLGTSFSIQTEENIHYMDVLYNHVKKTINEIEKATIVNDPLKIAILASLQISDELYKEKIKVQNYNKSVDLTEAENLTLKMIQKIEQVL